MKIAMIGTGYVGLVSGVCLSDFGHEVVCVDKNQDKLALLREQLEVPPVDAVFEFGEDDTITIVPGRPGTIMI